MKASRRSTTLLILLAALLCVFVTACEVCDDEDDSCRVMVNGRMAEGEWDGEDVALHQWGNGIELRLQQDDHFAYLCIFDPDTTHGGIDLFVDNLAGDVRLLHTSSALGEKHLTDTVWSDYEWGEHDLWTSNCIQSIWDGQTIFLSPECFEYQISKRLLVSDSMRVMVRLKRPGVVVPEGAIDVTPDTWTTVRLPD